MRLSAAQTSDASFSFMEAFCGDPWNPDPNAPFCGENANADYFYFERFDPESAALAWSLLDSADVAWTFQLGVQDGSVLQSRARARADLSIEVIPTEDGFIYGYVPASSFCTALQGANVLPTSLEIVVDDTTENATVLAATTRDAWRTYPIALPQDCELDIAKQLESDEEAPLLPDDGSLEPQCGSDGDPACVPYEAVTSLHFASKSLGFRRFVELAQRSGPVAAELEFRVIGELGWTEKYTAYANISPTDITVVQETKAETFFEVAPGALQWSVAAWPSVGSFEWALITVHGPDDSRVFGFVVQGDSIFVSMPHAAL